MPSIFISYRRGPSGYVAQSITEKLKNSIDSASIVLDVDSIPLGADFRKFLDEQVSKCDIFLAIISDEWHEELKHRFEDPTDFVQIEIRAALQRNIPVIPVLIGSASMPASKDLPKDLVELAYKQAAELRSGADYSAQFNRLVRGITQVLAEQEAARKAVEERQKTEAEAARKAAEERQKAEAARKAEEDRRRAEALRKAEEERQRAETARRATEERQKTEAEAARKAAEERQEAEGEAARKTAEAPQRAEIEHQRRTAPAASELVQAAPLAPPPTRAAHVSAYGAVPRALAQLTAKRGAETGVTEPCPFSETTTGLEAVALPETPPHSAFGRVVGSLQGFGSVLILAVGAMLVAEVLARHLFDHFLGTYDAVRVTIVGVVFFQLAGSLRGGWMSRSNAFMGRLMQRYPRFGHLVSGLLNAAGAIGLCLVGYASIEGAGDDWRRAIVVLGASLAAFQFLLLAFRDFRAVPTRKNAIRDDA